MEKEELLSVRQITVKAIEEKCPEIKIAKEAILAFAGEGFHGCKIDGLDDDTKAKVGWYFKNMGYIVDDYSSDDVLISW